MTEKRITVKETLEEVQEENIATLMYLGPPIITEGLRQFSVYKNIDIKKLSEQYDGIAHLFVEINKYNEAVRQLDDKNSELVFWFYKVLEKIEGGRK